MPARKKVAKKPAAKGRPSSGKSGKSGWASYRAKEELARLRQENELRKIKEGGKLVPVKEELQDPPLNAQFVAAVKKEEELAAIQNQRVIQDPEELAAIQYEQVKEELPDKVDATTQTPKHWARELNRGKIVRTRPRYINGVSPLDSPPPQRFRRAPSLDPTRHCGVDGCDCGFMCRIIGKA
ncbi:OTUD4, partial [Symbiodinium sp. KB8]